MMQSRRYAFGGLLLVIALWPLVGSGQNGMSNGQWRAYSADEGSTRYSSLDQVTKENVKNLQVAWTWKFDNFGTPAETVTTETTPLMVNGVLYFTAGQRRTLSPRTPARVRRCGRGGPMKVPASTRRRARCTAASRTGPTAKAMNASCSSRLDSISSR